jgi:lipopolysaccharide export system permease protein
MMILSRFIIKEWFKNLFGAIFVLFLLISTADLINGFLQGKDATRVLLEYSLKMPDLMGKMMPICCLIATLFAINKLKAHSELISILAAGYSYTRIYTLIGTCSLFMVVVQFMNLGFLEPMANSVKRREIEKSRKSEGKYLTRSSLEGGKFWYKTKEYFASFSYYDRKSKALAEFELYFFNEDHKSTKIIRSNKAVYVGNSKWDLDKVTELSSLNSSTFPAESKTDHLVLELSEEPEDFGEFEADLTTLTFFKLSDFVRRLSKTGINIADYEVIILNKVFLSICCFIFSLIPLSSIFNPNRRSSSFGKSVVYALLIAIAFWVLYSASVAFGNSGTLPPLVATGAMPTIALCFVAFTFLKNRKLAI